MSTTIKNLRLALTTLGVFLIMGAFISYLQANGNNTLGANSCKRYKELRAASLQQVELKPAVKKEELRMAVIHASHPDLRITELKNHLKQRGHQYLLKADSRTAVQGSYVFLKDPVHYPFVEYELQQIIGLTVPHTQGDVSIEKMADFGLFTIETGLQNVPLGGGEIYAFDLSTLYQSSTDIAQVADIIVVIGK